MRVVELDLLRFVAAFGVVMFHYVAWYVLNHPQHSYVLDHLEVITRYGYLGVPVFFAISGFVILASALNRNYLEFAVSRAIRLYPVYWACVSITALAIFLTGRGNTALDTTMYLVNLSMLQSFVGMGSVDGVYWTLAKELQFYGCVFILLLFRVIHYVRSWLSIWLFITLLYQLTAQPFFMGKIISPEYSPYFIAGVALYMIRLQRDVRFYTVILLIALLSGSYSIYQVTESMTNYPQDAVKWWSVVLINLAMLIFYLVACRKIQLNIRPIYLIIGGLTYPLYLLHNVAGKILMDSYLAYLGPVLSAIITLLLVLLLSFILYQYYEKQISSPIKRFLLEQIKRWQRS